MDNKIIAKGVSKFYLIHKSDYNIKDIICIFDNKIIKIEKEIFDEKFLDELIEKNIIYNIDLNELVSEGGTFTKEELRKEVLERYKSDKRLQELRNKREQKEKQRENEEEEKRIKDFEEKSICDFGYLKVDKKTILKDWRLFTFKKNVNKLFDYVILKKKNFGWGGISNLSSFENFIIKNKIDYIKEATNEGLKNIRLYELEFEKGDNMVYPKIKGVKIPQNKLGFILGRIHKEQTTEQIKLLKKLTGMKISLLDLKEVCCKDCEIDINIFLINENNFEVEFMNRKETLDWDILRDVFFYRGTSRTISRYLSQTEFFTFCGMFGLTKQDVFAYVKKLKMLKELKNETD